ncbi:hypothetical protein AgCh_031428 [Apium graveolens]
MSSLVIFSFVDISEFSSDIIVDISEFSSDIIVDISEFFVEEMTCRYLQSSCLQFGLSISVFRNSDRPALSTTRVCNNALGEEALSLPRRLSNARYICHLRKSGDLVDAVVPFMGESISDGTLATFLKLYGFAPILFGAEPGDKVDVDEPIAQVETDKVTIDVASPEAGVIQKFVAKEGDTVEPGTKIAVISKSGERVASSKKTSDGASSQPSFTEHKIEEGPNAGAATKAKKLEAATSPPPPPEKPKATTPLPPPNTSPSDPQLPPKERERRVPMTRLRKRVASRLKDSQNTFALLTTFNEVDIATSLALSSCGSPSSLGNKRLVDSTSMEALVYELKIKSGPAVTKLPLVLDKV